MHNKSLAVIPQAGIAAATALGASVPWTPRSTSPKMSYMDRFYMGVFDKFAKAGISVGYLRMILPNGDELHYGSKDNTAAPVAPGQSAGVTFGQLVLFKYRYVYRQL